MSRGLTTANATAAAQRHVRPIDFLELRYDAPTGTLYLHNGVGNYTWGGHTWSGLGALGAMSPIEETEEQSAYRVSYQLSGVNTTIITQALNENIYKRLAIRYAGFLDENGQLVDTPHELRRDFMDQMPIAQGGEIDTVTLNCESEMIRDTRAPGRMFSDEDQQVAFAGDTGFQFLPQLIDADIHWGPGGDQVTSAPRDRDRFPRLPRHER